MCKPRRRRFAKRAVATFRKRQNKNAGSPISPRRSRSRLPNNMPTLLHYRPWQGEFHSPWWSVWPIARVALGNLFRRKLFWTLYAFGLLLFLMFFFGAYLLAWAESQLAVSQQQFRLGDPGRMLNNIRRALAILNGSQATFQYFFAYQGAIVVVTLALVGSVLVGNDFTYKSLAFYLAKPISRWQYILGKWL